MTTTRLLALAVLVAAGAAASEPPRPLDVGPHERLVVVAPHPDDETLGAAGLVQRVLARGGSARVVLMTAGDGYVEAVVHATGLPQPRPAEYLSYGERRLREARAAVRELGGPHVRLQLASSDWPSPVIGDQLRFAQIIFDFSFNLLP